MIGDIENIKDFKGFLKKELSHIKNDININMIYTRAEDMCLADSVKKTMDIWEIGVDYRASMIVLSILKELGIGNKGMIYDITDRYIAILNRAGICTVSKGKCELYNCTCEWK